jgi:hypothetical protein
MSSLVDTSSNRWDLADTIIKDFITFSVQNGTKVYSSLDQFNAIFDPFLLPKNISYSVFSTLNDRQTLFTFINIILSTYG